MYPWGNPDQNNAPSWKSIFLFPLQPRFAKCSVFIYFRLVTGNNNNTSPTACTVKGLTISGARQQSNCPPTDLPFGLDLMLEMLVWNVTIVTEVTERTVDISMDLWEQGSSWGLDRSLHAFGPRHRKAAAGTPRAAIAHRKTCEFNLTRQRKKKQGGFVL